MNNLVKMTRAEYTTAKANRTLVCPNVALISDENGHCEFLPNNPTSDIGIAALENGQRTFYSLAEWNALETKPTALGTYVFTSDTQFILHGTIGSSLKYLDTTTVAVEGVTTTTSSASALQDFAGAANTQALLDAVTAGIITNAQAASWASGLTLADNAGCYLLAAGQVELVSLNLEAINNCRAALGQSEIVFTGKYIWSSTQYNASYAWGWYTSYWNSLGKNGSYLALAGAAL